MARISLEAVMENTKNNLNTSYNIPYIAKV